MDDGETDAHTMVCTVTTRVSVDTRNIGTATGFSPAGTPKQSTDDALVDIVTPAITVVKTAGNAADGTTLYTNGGDVTYTYLVTNTGEVDPDQRVADRQQARPHLLPGRPSSRWTTARPTPT